MEHAISGLLEEFCAQQLQTLDECLAMPSWADVSDTASDFTDHGLNAGRASPSAYFALRTDTFDLDFGDTPCVPMAPLLSSTSMSTESESGGDDDGATAGVANARGRNGPKTKQAASSSKSGQSSQSSHRKPTAAKRARVEYESICGVLQPFDAVKNYGTGKAMSLQQLNAKIKGTWKMQ